MKDPAAIRLNSRRRRHARIRKKVQGTAERPRMAVRRSLRHGANSDRMVVRTRCATNQLLQQRMGYITKMQKAHVGQYTEQPFDVREQSLHDEPDGRCQQSVATSDCQKLERKRLRSKASNYHRQEERDNGSKQPHMDQFDTAANTPQLQYGCSGHSPQDTQRTNALSYAKHNH